MPAERGAGAAVEETPAPANGGLSRLLFSGSSALGVATLLERGLGFLANLAAARLGGTGVFGAYSTAMTTASNVASYAGAGIGTTANRFSGEYPYGSPGYAGLLQALSLVSLASAALATTILWFSAGALATHLLRNPALAGLLRLAALSAGAIILLECLRGLLIGQRRFGALLALSVLFGGGMAAMLPLAAHRGASAMVAGQCCIALSAIAICIVAARRLRFAPASFRAAAGQGPRSFSIVRFGLVQLAGMIGLNAAGWWVASLVARSDVTLAQAAWYAAAMQLRNMCSMPAGLIAQTAYAQLTENGASRYGGPGRVTVLATVVASIVSLLIAGPAVALMPWVMPHLYGRDFAGAQTAATLAVAVGLIHMSAAPAAARLTVVSLPLTGVINGMWSVLLIGLGSWLISGGGASQAAACFLWAHLFSACAVLIALFRRDESVRGELVLVSVPALAGALLLAGLGWLRASSAQHSFALSAGMLAATPVLIWCALLAGRGTSESIRRLSFSGIVSAVCSGGRGRFSIRSVFAA
jgi:O-antigen/teichoic acid export membrane protein